MIFDMEVWCGVRGLPGPSTELFSFWIVGDMFDGVAGDGEKFIINYHAARELSKMRYHIGVRGGLRGYTRADIAEMLHHMTWESKSAAIYWLLDPRDICLRALAVHNGSATPATREAAGIMMGIHTAAELTQLRPSFEREHVRYVRTDRVYDFGGMCSSGLQHSLSLIDSCGSIAMKTVTARLSDTRQTYRA
jgi:hypothetical protein